MSPSTSFLVREAEEYDRRHGSSSAAGSSYAGSSSSSGARPLPVKRQWSKEPEDVVVVKEEPEELGPRGVVGPEDFVADVDAVAAAIAERSLHEEAERERHDEEIECKLQRNSVSSERVPLDPAVLLIASNLPRDVARVLEDGGSPPVPFPSLAGLLPLPGASSTTTSLERSFGSSQASSPSSSSRLRALLRAHQGELILPLLPLLLAVGLWSP
ncbi:CDPK-related protein kinase [Hordeum vulgare]|nr:CDPK-related protein kinase [Hordeum vulgare]